MLRRPADSTMRDVSQPPFTLIEPPRNDAAAQLSRSLFVSCLSFAQTATKGLGIVTVRCIAAGSVLGQYRGRIVNKNDNPGVRSAYVLDVSGFVYRANRAKPDYKYLFTIDARATDNDASLREVTVNNHTYTANEQQPSWPRYINSIEPTDAKDAANVEYVYDTVTGMVNVISSRTIPENTELLVDYGRQYFFADLSNVFVDARVSLNDAADLARNFGADAALVNAIRNEYTNANALVLREKPSQPVALIIYDSSAIYAILTIEVRNALDLVELLLTRVYQLAIITSKRLLTARREIFGDDDELARRLFFDPIVSPDAQNRIYVRRVPRITVVAVDALAEFAEKWLRSGTTECPELNQFPLLDAREDDDGASSRRRRTRRKTNNTGGGGGGGGGGGSDAEQPLRLFVAKIDARVAGVMVVNVTTSTDAYVEFVCVFDMHAQNVYTEDLRAYILERMIVYFESDFAPDTTRLYVAPRTKDLMTNRQTLRLYKQAKKTRDAVSRVQDTVLYTS